MSVRQSPRQQIDRVSKTSPVLSQGPFSTEWLIVTPNILQRGACLHSQVFFLLPPSAAEAVQATGHPSHSKEDEGFQRLALLLFPGWARVKTDTNLRWPWKGQYSWYWSSHLLKVSGDSLSLPLKFFFFTEGFWANPTCRYTSGVLNFICTTEQLKVRHVWWKF